MSGTVEHEFFWAHSGNEVIVTGTWDNWQKSTQLIKGEDDVFRTTVKFPANTGKVLYKYVVDGEWKTDDTDGFEMDSNGIVNNIIYILEDSVDTKINHQDDSIPSETEISAPEIVPSNIPVFADKKENSNVYGDSLKGSTVEEVAAQDNDAPVAIEIPDVGEDAITTEVVEEKINGKQGDNIEDVAIGANKGDAMVAEANPIESESLIVKETHVSEVEVTAYEQEKNNTKDVTNAISDMGDVVAEAMPIESDSPIAKETHVSEAEANADVKEDVLDATPDTEEVVAEAVPIKSESPLAKETHISDIEAIAYEKERDIRKDVEDAHADAGDVVAATISIESDSSPIAKENHVTEAEANADKKEDVVDVPADTGKVVPEAVPIKAESPLAKETHISELEVITHEKENDNILGDAADGPYGTGDAVIDEVIPIESEPHDTMGTQVKETEAIEKTNEKENINTDDVANDAVDVGDAITAEVTAAEPETPLTKETFIVETDVTISEEVKQEIKDNDEDNDNIEIVGGAIPIESTLATENLVVDTETTSLKELEKEINEDGIPGNEASEVVIDEPTETEATTDTAAVDAEPIIANGRVAIIQSAEEPTDIATGGITEDIVKGDVATVDTNAALAEETESIASPSVEKKEVVSESAIHDNTTKVEAPLEENEVVIDRSIIENNSVQNTNIDVKNTEETVLPELNDVSNAVSVGQGTEEGITSEPIESNSTNAVSAETAVEGNEIIESNQPPIDPPTEQVEQKVTDIVQTIVGNTIEKGKENGLQSRPETVSVDAPTQKRTIKKDGTLRKSRRSLFGSLFGLKPEDVPVIPSKDDSLENDKAVEVEQTNEPNVLTSDQTQEQAFEEVDKANSGATDLEEVVAATVEPTVKQAEPTVADSEADQTPPTPEKKELVVPANIDAEDNDKIEKKDGGGIWRRFKKIFE